MDWKRTVWGHGQAFWECVCDSFPQPALLILILYTSTAIDAIVDEQVHRNYDIDQLHFLN